MTQTIEQLQAKVAELEKELLKTKLDLLTSYGESEELSGRIAELEKENTRLHEQVDLQIPAIAFKQLTEQLAAAQEEIERLKDGAVCGDCDGSGWLENRVEGRYPCTCMTEAEPYQLLHDQLTKAEQLWQVAKGRCDGLEEKLAKAEQRVAEACKSMCLSLDRKEKNHAAGYGIGYLNYSAQDVADLIDNGKWRKFVKEV